MRPEELVQVRELKEHGALRLNFGELLHCGCWQYDPVSDLEVTSADVRHWVALVLTLKLRPEDAAEVPVKPSCAGHCRQAIQQL